jgi:excisionase family DNA binding protein
MKLLEDTGGENLVLKGAYGEVALPTSLAAVIGRLCRYLSLDAAVAIVPYQAELTTQAAANLLGISRTRLIQLIDRGDLGARREGAHRRLKFGDVVAYRDLRSKGEETARRRLSGLIAGTHGGDAELEDARQHAARLPSAH